MSTPTLSDCDLIERFLAGGRNDADSAFEVLVKRHGPMVWGVCNQTLGHVHDAEDAFQATFLVLARKAGTIRDRRALGGWLSEVAYRVAARARDRAARRRFRGEVGDAQGTAGWPGDDVARTELRSVVRAEVAGLTDDLRTPVVLCYLGGETSEQVARLLGCPVGTVKSRLSRARALLRSRLSRHGVDADLVERRPA
jgi:RNA polymerase sigma-70 factor (ECF subfamily)